MKDTSNADLTIKATGYQWKWGYDYLNGEGAGIGFLSTLDATQREMSDAGKPTGDDYLLQVDNPLVVPVNKKVRIITTANDVIHAWMVPSLGVKQDAIPGFVRDTWFRAEQDRRLLRPVRRAVRQGARLHADPRQGAVAAGLQRRGSTSGRRRWRPRPTIRTRSGTWPTCMARGEKVYAANCAVCHQPDGKGGGGRSRRSTARRSCSTPTRPSRSTSC